MGGVGLFEISSVNICWILTCLSLAQWLTMINYFKLLMIKIFLGCIKESAPQWDLTIPNGGEYSHRQKAVLGMCVFLLFL